MSYKNDVLNLRIMLCLLNSTNDSKATVTKIAKTLGREKYQITRALSSLEKDGYVYKTPERRPLLTSAGRLKAEEYKERTDIAASHLTYEGLDIENAKSDSFHWALYGSDKSIEVIKKTEAKYTIKHAAKSKHDFGGDFVCKKMRNGAYDLPFALYTADIGSDGNLSALRDEFDGCCTLKIEDENAAVQIRLADIAADSSGITGVEYSDGFDFISAEKYANVFSFPILSMRFFNIGSGDGQIISGSIMLRIKCKNASETVLFTLFI